MEKLFIFQGDNGSNQLKVIHATGECEVTAFWQTVEKYPNHDITRLGEFLPSAPAKPYFSYGQK